MEPPVWTIMAAVPSFTFVLAAVTPGNSPVNQLRSGCHRLDIGQSHLSLRRGVGLQVEQTRGALWGGSISETRLSTVGTLELVMEKLPLGKEEGTRDLRFQPFNLL